MTDRSVLLAAKLCSLAGDRPRAWWHDVCLNWRYWLLPQVWRLPGRSTCPPGPAIRCRRWTPRLERGATGAGPAWVFI